LRSERSGQSRDQAILVTGANGEFGHGLIRALHQAGHRHIVALDLRELDPELRPLCRDVIVGDIVDRPVLARLLAVYEIHEIFHLAALLSTRGEFTPEAAHEVNVSGTINLLQLASNQAATQGRWVKFLFPSSIAVYGIPDLETKVAADRIQSDQFLEPTTMYGCNKLACEHHGRYYARHYQQLAKDRPAHGVDFRSIRFPGVISAFTMPSGGTSDYASEMIHAAARGSAYHSFVREDTRIPFITMPDAIGALVKLAAAPHESLRRCVYDIAGFNPSAGEIAELVRDAFPNAEIDFQPDLARQRIVDSWPAEVDDAQARADWGWAPSFDLQSAFADYLVPNIREHYSS